MAYEYDHDCPFEAFITNLGKYNEGELVGEWVKFPTTSEELQKVFERIGIGSKDDFGNPYEEWFMQEKHKGNQICDGENLGTASGAEQGIVF
jgi:hypothetical protein